MKLSSPNAVPTVELDKNDGVLFVKLPENIGGIIVISIGMETVTVGAFKNQKRIGDIICLNKEE